MAKINNIILKKSIYLIILVFIFSLKKRFRIENPNRNKVKLIITI